MTKYVLERRNRSSGDDVWQQWDRVEAKFIYADLVKAHSPRFNIGFDSASEAFKVLDFLVSMFPGNFHRKRDYQQGFRVIGIELVKERPPEAAE